MNPTNFTLIAIASAFFAAIANILARTILKNIRSQDMLGINFLTIAATLVLFSPLFYFFQATPLTMALVVTIALIDTAANYFYFKTFEATKASIATPLLSLAPAFTFLFGWIFLSDSTQPLTYVWAIAILLLTIIFSTDWRDFARFRYATLAPALLASILFGVSAIPARYLLHTLSAINAPTLYLFRAALIALFSLLLFRFPLQSFTNSDYRNIFIRSLFVTAQWVLLYAALTIGHAGVTITLGNITPIFVFLLSVIFLREKPTIKKSVAATLIFILSLLL